MTQLKPFFTLLLAGLLISACAEDLPTPLAQYGTWEVNFDDAAPGPYTSVQLNKDWHNPRWRMGRNLITVVDDANAYAGKSLQLRYPKGISSCQGSDICVHWPVDLGVKLERIYYGYRFKLADNFDFIKGGKFPGVAGGTANSGGEIPNGKDGWSVRMMWNDEYQLVQYIYHPDQPGTYGDVYVFDTPGTIERGKWHTVQTYVQLNTPGVKDGIVVSWLDGKPVMTKRDLRFRDIPGLEIDRLQFVSFFGGNGPEWAPTKDEFSYLDDVRISVKPPFFDVSPAD